VAGETGVIEINTSPVKPAAPAEGRASKRTRAAPAPEEAVVAAGSPALGARGRDGGVAGDRGAVGAETDVDGTQASPATFRKQRGTRKEGKEDGKLPSHLTSQPDKMAAGFCVAYAYVYTHNAYAYVYTHCVAYAYVYTHTKTKS